MKRIQRGQEPRQLALSSFTSRSRTDKPTPLSAMLVAAIGLYPLAIGLKILPIASHSLHTPHWVMVAVGLILIFAGASIGLQCIGAGRSILNKICITLILVCMLATPAWLVFGNSHLSLLFRLAFSTPFIFIGLLLLPFGKTRIIQGSNLEQIHGQSIESGNDEK